MAAGNNVQHVLDTPLSIKGGGSQVGLNDRHGCPSSRARRVPVQVKLRKGPCRRLLSPTKPQFLALIRDLRLYAASRIVRSKPSYLTLMCTVWVAIPPSNDLRRGKFSIICVEHYNILYPYNQKSVIFNTHACKAMDPVTQPTIQCVGF